MNKKRKEPVDVAVVESPLLFSTPELLEAYNQLATTWLPSNPARYKPLKSFIQKIYDECKRRGVSP